jgi:LPS O-antigen subunit length determinant protein (WzzB/FepE family)
VTFINQGDINFSRQIRVTQTEEIELSAMNETLPSDEIDLLQLIETIWDGKWKIIAITAACVLGVLGFQDLGPAPSFVATTEIKPILAGDAEAYRQSNALGFFAVYRDIESRDQAQLSARDRDRDRDRDREKTPSAELDQLFIEQLGSLPLLAGIFKKHGLLVQEGFDSDRDYERALTQLAATLAILPPVNEDGTKRGESRRHHTLQFEFKDEGKWLAALADLKDTANKNVRNAVKSRFENLQSSAKQKRAFAIEDLDAQIAIMIGAYDAETSSKLAHLAEQAAIAKKLGIAKQTSIPQPSFYQSLNTQDFASPDNRPSKIETEIPLYLRGYDALEKEIDLIKSRQDKRPFIEGLLPLEQQKLALAKDQTPERAERLFAATPVMKSGDFQAVSFDINATEFEYKSKRALMLALAVVVGGMIGVVYVLIASAMRGRREAEAG